LQSYLNIKLKYWLKAQINALADNVRKCSLRKTKQQFNVEIAKNFFLLQLN